MRTFVTGIFKVVYFPCLDGSDEGQIATLWDFDNPYNVVGGKVLHVEGNLKQVAETENFLHFFFGK